MIRTKVFAALSVIALVVASGLALAVLAQAGTHDKGQTLGRSISGAGTTMVEGGTGPPSFTPIVTKVAFHWRKSAGSFECLALAPSAKAGAPGSGDFDTNIMYVTGEITAAEIGGHNAVLKGSATVTDAGAGSNRPFTATVTRGGPGATLVLEISGLTFKEIMLQGEFSF
jgi:hypothetical protein